MRDVRLSVFAVAIVAALASVVGALFPSSAPSLRVAIVMVPKGRSIAAQSDGQT